MSPTLAQQITQAQAAQAALAAVPMARRVALMEAYALQLKASREMLAALVAEDAGKTLKDAQTEVDGAIDSISRIISQASLPDFVGMTRQKIRPPVGLVALITSFNFPIAVAHWNITPAIIAGNAVLWKASEKTPRTAPACKKLFDAAAGAYADALQIVAGDRAVGAALVADERVDMISATGSVAMGEAIRRTLAVKQNNGISPILELGGNNAVVIGAAMSDAHLEFALQSVLTSFLGGTGQRCTNTRRLIVHASWLEKTISVLERLLGDFITSGAMRDVENIYGYHRLVDADAQARFAAAKQQALAEGGRMIFGGEGEPALMVMPRHTPVMHQETFAPLLYLLPYDGGIEAAMALVNAPENAGLVNGLYSLSHAEVDRFVALNAAGHSVINSPKGTGTPAFGMGFGGNKASGCGEILWSGDPLAAFTRAGPITRVAIHSAIVLE